MGKKEKIINSLNRFAVFKRYYTKHKVHKTKRFMMSPYDLRAAEVNTQIRTQLTQKYIKRWPESARTVNSMIAELLKHTTTTKNGEELSRYADDMRFCYFAYGFLPGEYVSFHLFDKSPAERKTFVSFIDSICYEYRMNDYSKLWLFRDKMNTYERFKPYYHRAVISINGPEDYAEFERFATEHPTFVKKVALKSYGEGVELVKIGNGRSVRETFDSLLSQGKTALEEQIIQAPVMMALNPSSVNTVRCYTLFTKQGVKIPFCTMRMGRKGSFVDNGGAGGIMARIDMETGTLYTDGIDEYGARYEVHPDTGIRFIGYALPDWQQMCAICKEMASSLPSIRFIGWDMAYSEKDGWVVVEGNSLPGVIAPQATVQQGLQDAFKGFMSNMDLCI